MSGKNLKISYKNDGNVSAFTVTQPPRHCTHSQSPGIPEAAKSLQDHQPVPNPATPMISLESAPSRSRGSCSSSDQNQAQRQCGVNPGKGGILVAKKGQAWKKSQDIGKELLALAAGTSGILGDQEMGRG